MLEAVTNNLWLSVSNYKQNFTPQTSPTGIKFSGMMIPGMTGKNLSCQDKSLNIHKTLSTLPELIPALPSAPAKCNNRSRCWRGPNRRTVGSQNVPMH